MCFKGIPTLIVQLDFFLTKVPVLIAMVPLGLIDQLTGPIKNLWSIVKRKMGCVQLSINKLKASIIATWVLRPQRDKRPMLLHTDAYTLMQ